MSQGLCLVQSQPGSRRDTLAMTPQDNWTPLCSVKSHLSQSPHNQLEDQSLLSAVQCVGCGEWLEVAHQTLQRREQEAQRQKGDVWRQCSNLLLLWEVYLEKHPKQLPKLPINQCKADLLQQEIPISYLLSPATLQLFSGCPAPLLRGQQYQFSNQKHPQNLSRTAVPHHQTVVHSCFPSLPSPLRSSAARRSHGLPPHALLLKNSVNQLKFSGRGEGSQSVRGNGAWPQTASQLHPSCESEPSPRSPGQKPPQEGQ